MEALGPAAAVWDTTVLSRIHPANEVAEYVLGRAAIGEPVPVAAPAVLEVAYGYELRAAADTGYRRLLDWFTTLVAADSFNIVPLDGRAAIVAGQLRGRSPDIEIAASAFAAGLDVATLNRADFEFLSGRLAELYPGAPPLLVSDPPV